jgi:hypothetical protein
MLLLEHFSKTLPSVDESPRAHLFHIVSHLGELKNWHDTLLRKINFKKYFFLLLFFSLLCIILRVDFSPHRRNAALTQTQNDFEGNSGGTELHSSFFAQQHIIRCPPQE